MPLSQSPTGPGGGMTQGGIDQPPPLPPNMRTPDVSTLAGNYNQGGAPPQGELASMALQQGMLLEKVVVSLATMLPAFAPAASQIQQILRQALAQSLAAAQQGSSSNGPVPQGAAGPPPSGPGAAPPQGGGGSQLGSGPLG